MSEDLFYFKKKYSRILFLIVFGIIFYLFINDNDNFNWIFNALKPILIAFAIAYLLDPAVKFFCRKFKIRRGFSILIVFVLLIFLVIYAVIAVIPSLIKNCIDLLQLMPSLKKISTIIQNIMSSIEANNLGEFTPYLEDSLESALNKFSIITTNLLQEFIKKIFSITSGLFSAIVSLIIAIYMLIDKDDLLARFKRAIYAYRKKEDADYLIDIVKRSNDIFSNFLIGKIIDSIIIGILCFIILLITKMPYATIIALVVGITNIIPYFGPFMGGIPSVIVLLLVDPIKAFWLAIIILILQQFDGLYLGPKILGDKVGVRAFWIITAVTVGGIVAGVLGMFLGVPAMVLIKSIIEQSIEKKLEKKGMKGFEMDKIK